MIDDVCEIACQAGNLIMDVYDSGEMNLKLKSDESPLTRADLLAHKHLSKALHELYSIPILSEEDEETPWRARKAWQRYWLIDPLDGTKEFIKRNGEFTVNIALIENGKPILGVVYAPVKKLWYFGAENFGAFRKHHNESPEAIAPSKRLDAHQPWRVVGSRSHTSDDFTNFLGALENYELVSVGSSLKLCMIAEGSADLYPRLIPTCEWDTAAGQAVVEAAGGLVLNWETLMPLRYNTKESLLNPYFLVCGDQTVASQIKSH